jgi:hypothetical protein
MGIGPIFFKEISFFDFLEESTGLIPITRQEFEKEKSN